MDTEDWALGIPGVLNSTGEKLLGNLVWLWQNSAAVDQIELALFRFQAAHPSLRLMRRDGKVVTEWRLLLGSLQLGFLRVSKQVIEVDASVQALDAWRFHALAAEGDRLWRTLMMDLYRELRVGAATPEELEHTSNPEQPAGKTGKQPQVPKGKALARWQATWRYVRPNVERGLTNPRDLLGLLARDTNTKHLGAQSEDTMRKIVTAGLAGRLNG